MKEGTPARGSRFGKASLLYGETVIEYHSVNDIAALQQHDKVEICRVGKNRPSRPPIVGSEVYRRQRRQLCYCLFYVPGYLLFYTRYRVVCLTHQRGSSNPGRESPPRLVAAGA